MGQSVPVPTDCGERPKGPEVGDDADTQLPPPVRLQMTSSFSGGSPAGCDSAQGTPATVSCPDNFGPPPSSSSSASTHDGGDLTTLWYEAADGGAALFLRSGVDAKVGPVTSEAWATEQGQPNLVTDGRARSDEDESSRALFRDMTNTEIGEYAREESSADLTGKWYNAPGDLGTEHLEPPAEDEVMNFDDPKHTLVEMGFSEGDASVALQRSQRWGGGVLEAANILAEQQKAEQQKPSWGSAITGLVTDLFSSSASSSTESYKPGKYKVVVGQTASSAADGSPRGRVVEGEVVDIEELHFPTTEGGWMRGRMADGRWINIHSLIEGRSCIWAKPLNVETQLLDLGFPADKAREAARRCSSVEAAVQFLAGELD